MRPVLFLMMVLSRRLNDQSFLCHTTSGGADRVFAWLEEWLQTEWHHLKVFIVNLTEQYSQIAVAGPKLGSFYKPSSPLTYPLINFLL